ncbi:hypothetical protein ACHAWF_016432 [Thalassiosira exigua]
MHDTTKPLPHILSSYPRGEKELRGLYTKRFTPDDAYDWFTSRGVVLKTESDGRMFPVTDDSQTIIDVITDAAVDAGVEVRLKEKVEGLEFRDIDANGSDGCFAVRTASRTPGSSARTTSEEHFDAIILATGSFPPGHDIARSLGHAIVPPVPSLFTLDSKSAVKDEGGVFHGLAGVSVPMARLTLTATEDMTSISTGKPEPTETNQENATNVPTTKKKRKRKKKPPVIVQEGPLLVTHTGISGPAALRLSAFAAREFHAVGYRCRVTIHFCPVWEEEQSEARRAKGGAGGSGEGTLMDALWDMTRATPKRRVITGCPLLAKASGDAAKHPPVVPKRLWSALVNHVGISSALTWGDASKSSVRSLANALSAFPLEVTSKGTFKEEFVTAGGVSLKEMRTSTMESKIVSGLFFCGEMLDVDGVTGGFNFMGCWSTGFVAGEGAVAFCLEGEGG